MENNVVNAFRMRLVRSGYTYVSIFCHNSKYHVTCYKGNEYYDQIFSLNELKCLPRVTVSFFDAEKFDNSQRCVQDTKSCISEEGDFYFG